MPQVDPDVQAFLDAIGGLGLPDTSTLTPDEARRQYAAAPKPPGDAIARVEDRSIAGVPCRLYADVPAGGTPLPVVAFFHGGGWVLSDLDGHDALCRRIAKLTGALVVSVDYRLAPEHPFPAPHDDCWAVTAWLAEHAAEVGGDPARVAACGDSAGGNLAAGVAIRARDEGVALRGQALVYPCVDPDPDRPSHRENAVGFMLTEAAMQWFWEQYVPADRRTDPRAVPMAAPDLAGVAPTLVQTADLDVLRDEGEAYAERLRAAGVPTTSTRYPGVVHGFVSRWQQMARAHDAHAELAGWLRAALA